jgi:hypothetical protein
MRRFSIVALGTLLLAAALLPMQPRFTANAVSDGERLAMFSKPSVVRIIDGVAGTFYFAPPRREAKTYTVSYVGLGSGFFIDSNGYIATNAHVVSTSHDINQKGEESGQELLFYQLLQQVARDYNVDPNSLTRENVIFVRNYSRLTDMKLFHHVIIPDGSVYEFEEKQYGAPTGQGKDVAIIKIEVKNAPVLLLGDSTKVTLQDHVTVLGYPGAADTFNSGVLDSKSALEASITDGKVSASKKSSSGAPILQVSAPATHGNSGGPVMTDKNEVIGLLTFGGDRVNNQEVSGFVFVVPSSTVQEFVKAAGVSNQLGPSDTAYREGLELYWDERYSKAIPKFEEAKRLFPEHSEVARLIQSSQQSIAEGKEKSSMPSTWTIIITILVIMFLVVALLVIALVLLFVLRRRGKKKQAIQAGPAPAAMPAPKPAPRAQAPTPAAPPPSYTPPAPRPSPMPEVASARGDQGMTIDLSRTVAITPDGDTSPISYGSIRFTSGVLAGQHFDVKPDGSYLGRDSSMSQIVLADPRISKRHLWIGVRDGNVVIADQGSRNGTFLNDPKTARVTETVLKPGDTVILGESDVARFEYHR